MSRTYRNIPHDYLHRYEWRLVPKPWTWGGALAIVPVTDRVEIALLRSDKRNYYKRRTREYYNIVHRARRREERNQLQSLKELDTFTDNHYYKKLKGIAWEIW